jgi:hypothetical protein
LGLEEQVKANMYQMGWEFCETVLSFRAVVPTLEMFYMANRIDRIVCFVI